MVQELEQKLGRKLSNKAIALAVYQSRAKKIKGISTAEVREQQLAQLQPDKSQALQKLITSVQPVRLFRRFEPENQALCLRHSPHRLRVKRSSDSQPNGS